ncbi:hypothetical protein ZYGR_0N04240 [Zygosaccharomyces rouxii]|uniref:Pre-mRNA-splicing factor SYF2 n=2 Tax=Zygosaccharomyces rouxii TaxID=4956 RepID=C5DVW8_ZYGRC|nr:uncharacterized protein ZYRO0D10032g [Zygosaccharomyces rouxii]KAH9200847.1 hypothetical protein LQ764DRAFT_234041 [Zygosaccharomyces rouxii]GAV49019.1 hypothetical protein ZYGR_0N04240 [Zygosaccharomyces rouxii]CAR27937.1 ZYRO0D10032p [Zygosaccharomyces rouxii]
MAIKGSQGSQMDLDQFIKDFNALKKKSWEISVENRKLVNAESKELAAGRKPRVYQLEAPEPSLPTQDDKHGNQLMNYTIQQYEEWNSRQRDQTNKRDSGNLQDMAKYTYDKELNKLHKDTMLQNRYTNGGSIQKMNRNPKTGKLTIKDDDQLVKKLAKDMDKTATERYEARRREMERSNVQNASSGGGYINEKNKQFNEKLDRQMPQSP